jgi:BirA family biotin operon repressor/biotin-[acetyl-CoA-carboxylase] ligase
MLNDLNIIYLEKVDSTNKYALSHFEKFSDNTLLVAGEQSDGRGRHNRQWLSPADTNIYASMIIKNAGENPALASMIISLGTLALLRKSAPAVKFWLKWPNDIFCREKKIAGILCESATIGGKITGIVAGVGININMSTELIKSIDQPATSLLVETTNKFNLKKLINELAKSLSKYYNIHSISPKRLFNCWKDENLLIGQTIEIDTGQARLKGKVIDLGQDGELIFESDGKQIKLFSGDIKINKNSIDFENF